MKHFTLFVVMLLLCFSGISQQNELRIIPKPNSIKYNGGTFSFSNQLRVTHPKSLTKSVDLFKSTLSKYEPSFIFTKKRSTPTINLLIDDKSKLEDEAYKIQINSEDIEITASTEKGLHWALQSMTQLLLLSPVAEKEKTISCATIVDQPRYEWRGIMLDESRHFFGVKKVKQLIDYMSLHKLNKFHWHLTDTPGWRIEIKKYPKLTSVGGKGDGLHPDGPVKYYTQKEIKEIVRYASKRGITIIPEIDMPGHASAANRAYPEFSGGGSDKYPNFTFHPANDATYQYLTDILREVADLFPADYIHLGGDEVHFGNHQWKTDAKVIALMKKENLKDLREVEQYFIRRMADSLVALGKHPMGWDEVIESGLDPKKTQVFWWRHDKPQLLDKAVEVSFTTVLCPRLPLYFDFIQSEDHNLGRTWGGFSHLEGIYAFPDALKNQYQSEHVVGIQACLWTEVIQSDKRLDFMTYPRLSVLAESAWTKKTQKNQAEFMTRLKQMYGLYKKDNLYYYDVFNPSSHSEAKVDE